MMLLRVWIVSATALLILKGLGVSDISWFWVFSPLIFGLPLQFLLIIVVTTAMRVTEQKWKTADPKSYYDYKMSEYQDGLNKRLMKKGLKREGAGQWQKIRTDKQSANKNTNKGLH